MESIYEQYELLQQIMDLIENHFGSRCEVVLHDNTKDYEHTIVDIRNGEISGRKVGDGGNAWGLEVMANEEMENHRYNKVMLNENGRVIRNSSIFFRNEEGENIGALCLNFDITPLVNIQNEISNYSLITNNNEPEEPFTNDVNAILDRLIEECATRFMKPGSAMSKEEKMECVRYLDNKGAFLITKSGDKVCKFLEISKFTLYSYLDIVRKEEKNK